MKMVFKAVPKKKTLNPITFIQNLILCRKFNKFLNTTNYGEKLNLILMEKIKEILIYGETNITKEVFNDKKI